MLDLDIEETTGSCHCGAVRFYVRLTDGLRKASRCTCSYCRMRGAVTVSANIADLVIANGQEILSRYQFGTNTAKHYFCSNCGVYTHHQRRSNPDRYAVNVACLDGVSPFDFDSIPVYDGVNHEADSASKKAVVVGVLRFERAPGRS